MQTLTADVKEWIRALPKTETHLHMEGAVPLEMVQAALPERFPGEPIFWKPDYRFENFDAFSTLFGEIAGAVFTSPEAYHQCAQHVFANLASQNCQYVETSIALGALVRSELDGPTVIDAILSAAPVNMRVRVFMGMRHNEYEGLGQELIEESLNWENLTGLDLHGPEYLPLEPWTADVWKRAREAGKFNKAHAGEFMPAAFVKRCVEELGVTRIQHGVRSVEDPEVVELLRDQTVTLDVCPISNVKLCVDGISEIKDHPIRQLIQSGVQCTINTDDPFFFGNTLCAEYECLYQHLDFGMDELEGIAKTGLARAQEIDRSIQR
ncbi:MAG: adenosine deaminase family protein [Opitutales bacterium]